MKSVKILMACLVAILVFSTLAYAEVPKMINYQGKITTPQGALISDTFSMVFSIYADSTSGTALWTETQTSVKVEFGVFSVLLGSVNSIPASVFDGNTRYLGLKVGNDNEMTPRKAIVSVGYAYHSGTADTAHFAMPDADWTINGDNVYHLNGNVGIGTITPGAKLDVNGHARFNSTELYGYPQYTFRSIFVGGSQGDLRWIKIPYSEAAPLRFTMFRGVHWDGSWLGQLAATVSATIGSWGSLAGNTFIRVEKADYPAYLLRQVIGCEGPGIDQSGIFLQVLGGRTYHFYGLPADPIDFGSSDPSCPSGSTALALGPGSGVWMAPAIYGNFAGTIDNADKVDGYHAGNSSGQVAVSNGILCTNLNADMLDGIQGDRFLRNDQSGTLNGNLTLNGSLSMGGGVNLNNNQLSLGTDGLIWWNTGANDIYVGAGADRGVVFRFAEPSRKLRFSHNGTDGVVASVLGGLYLDPQNGTITAKRINPATHNTYWLGAADNRWGDGYFVQIHAGSVIVDAMPTGVGTYVHADAGGKLMKYTSSKRYKENIRRLNLDTSGIFHLEPVKFNWKSTGEEDIGLIAEDVAQAVPDLVLNDKEGKPDAVKYDKISMFLLEIVKSQQKEIEVLKNRLEKLESKR